MGEYENKKRVRDKEVAREQARWIADEGKEKAERERQLHSVGSTWGSYHSTNLKFCSVRDHTTNLTVYLNIIQDSVAYAKLRVLE